MTRIAWLLGNWWAQMRFAFRIGYMDGYILKPGTRPKTFKVSDQS